MANSSSPPLPNVTIRGNNPRAQVMDYERRMRDIGRSHTRGVIYSLNGIAKQARAEIEAMLPQVIDQPVKWTERGIYHTYIPLKVGATGQLPNTIASDVHWKKHQSALGKYLMGQGTNVRKPGDIGPGDGHIYVPLAGPLKRFENIDLINGGNLPRSVLKALHRRAGNPIKTKSGRVVGTSAQTAAIDRTKNALFIGAPKVGGKQMGLGIYVRPKRGYVGEAKKVILRDANGNDISSGKKIKGRRYTNLGTPQMLVAMVDQTRHKPILQQPWDEITARAAATLPRRLERELASNIAHAARKRRP